jgi:hypothetical protein
MKLRISTHEISARSAQKIKKRLFFGVFKSLEGFENSTLKAYEI